MALHPETCSHCALAVTLTQRAYDAQRQPPEAIKEALLLGIGMGEIGAGDAPTCEECRMYIEALRAEHERLIRESGSAETVTPTSPAPQTAPSTTAGK
jgi:hypothetical protein